VCTVKSKTYTLHDLPLPDSPSFSSFVAESFPIISCIASSRGPVLNFAPSVALLPARERRLRMVNAFPESRMYASIAWSSGMRRRPSNIAMSLSQVSNCHSRKPEGHFIPASTRSAHQIEQLPRLLFPQPLAEPLIVHMFHELFQEDQSGQASDPSAIDGQEPHRVLVHCSGRAPAVKDPRGFAQVEQSCEMSEISHRRAQLGKTDLFIARLTCISLAAQPQS
jgi:hypothetical protein